jgi:hypothetical protein
LNRIAFTDRPWIPYRGMLSVGPVTPPSVEQIRSSLRMVASAFPDQPLVSRFDPAALRWQRVAPDELEDHLRTIVVGGYDIDAASLEEQSPVWVRDCDPLLPIKILVGEHCLTVLSSHALGDGRAEFALLERLLRCDERPEELLDWIGPSSDASTLRALTDFYVRKPWRIIRTLRSPRPAPASSVLPAADGPADSRPALVYSRADRETWSAIGEWRTRSFPEVSLASVLFMLICRAFASSGLDVDSSGFYMLVDNRRYLRGAAPLGGNLAKSVYVRPGDLSDPAKIQRTIRETVHSGRTLASSALSAATNERQRRLLARTGRSTGWVPNNEVILSLSYMGRNTSFEALPWFGDGDRWLGGAGTTGSPSGISVFCAEVNGELHTSVTYVPGRVDEAAVRRALATLEAGPPSGRRADAEDRV